MRTKLMFAWSRDRTTLLLLRKTFLPSIFDSVEFLSRMSCILLAIELAKSNNMKELADFIDGNNQGVSFCSTRKHRISLYAKVRWHGSNREDSTYMEKWPEHDQKRCVFRQTFETPKSSLTFQSRKKFPFIQQPVYYRHNQKPWLTTLMLP